MRSLLAGERGMITEGQAQASGKGGQCRCDAAALQDEESTLEN